MFRWMGWAAAGVLVSTLAGPAGAETIALANGNKLDGEVLERTDEVLVLQHENLGRLEIPVDQLAVETAKPGLLGTPFLRGWTRRLEVGVDGASGNSDFFNALVGLDLGYEDDYRRWDVSGGYTLDKQDGERSANRGYLGLTRDWLHPDRLWFPFVDTRYDYDEFRDWDHRLGGHAGIGYTLLKTERLRVLGRLGAGGSRTWGSEDDRFAPEGLAGLDATWKVNDHLAFTFSNKLFPDLQELGEFRNVTDAAWIVDLTGELAFKLGVDNRYESRVKGDAEANDVRYYGSILIGF